MTEDLKKYDLFLKQTTDYAYLVQPCRGTGYRNEDWIKKRHVKLIETRHERFGTVLCRIGVFEMDETFAKIIGLTEKDFSKEATIHEIGSNQ